MNKCYRGCPNRIGSLTKYKKCLEEQQKRNLYRGAWLLNREYSDVMKKARP